MRRADQLPFAADHLHHHAGALVEAEVIGRTHVDDAVRLRQILDLLDRIVSSCLQRDRTCARLRLRDFELASGEGAAYVDDTLLTVDVAFLECYPLRRT